MSVRSQIIDSIVEKFNNVKADAGYTGSIKSVIPWRENVSNTQKTSTPLVYVVDTGRETVLVEDAEQIRIAMDIHFQAVVCTDQHKDTVAALADIMSDCKKFISSNPLLGDACLRLRFVETGGIVMYPPEKMADCLLVARLRYVVTRGAF